MINQKYTRQFLTEHRPVAPGVSITEEGVALVYVRVPGEAELHVQPSTGAAGEVFAGFSWTRNHPPALLPKVQEGVVPVGGKIELDQVPVTGQLMIRVAGAALTIVAGAPADATEVQVVGTEVTFHADAVGSGYFAQMQFEPTVQQARQILGDMPIGGLASTNEGIIGVLTRADVATTMFDGAADFGAAELHPSLGADGRLTIGGGGTKLTNVVVVSAPSADVPYLTVRANV